mmetsp:Transcript_3494/g.6380  ORF Transcript_3494/g.6380 Transcript_3494/m.6380 type:complete len:146 (-) Transcript_3494:238-675(-)
MTMIIPIHAPANADSTEKVEWVMIELNGELSKPLDESRRTSQAAASLPGAVDDSRRRVELGSVKFDADGAPTVIIGNHQLKGTAITLKEPFAVLRKRKASQITKNGDSEGTSEAKLKSHCGVQLDVVGVVKRKLMFDKYPKSIMR